MREQFIELERVMEIAVRELLNYHTEPGPHIGLVEPIRFFQGALRCISEKVPVSAVRSAKIGCEELAGCISQAYQNGDKALGDFLWSQIENVSPAVAKLISLVPEANEEEASGEAA